MSSEESLLEFMAAAAGLGRVLSDVHREGIWHQAWNLALGSLTKNLFHGRNLFPGLPISAWKCCAGLSLPVQSWGHERSPCAPGNNLLCHEKRIME